jgi:flagellar protein FlbD
MIQLTRYDGSRFVISCEVIQYVESTPDTIITQTTGDKIMVKESVDEIIDLVIEFRQKIFAGALQLHRDENIDYIE